MSERDKAASSGQYIERGTIFPAFKINVPMPAGTAAPRPSPPPVATNKPPPRR